jgi:hypothetical protein
MKKTFFLILIILVCQTAASAQQSVILGAMTDELTRSIEKLKLDDKKGPYYLSYLVKDVHSLRIAADSGAITTDSEGHFRTLRTDLRVGSYALDNSNFISLSMPGITSLLTSASARLTIDNNYDVLRRQIWLATDGAYKAALETLDKKKASLQNMVQTEVLPDFTKGEGTSAIVPEASYSIQRSRWVPLVDQLSKLFLNRQEIQKSKVDLKIQIVNSYFVDSDGAKSVEPTATTRLVIAASTQADDGMPISNYLLYTSAHPDGLPVKARLDSDINAMITDLMAFRAAPVAEDYSGPVIFEGQATGELFSQGLSRYFLGRRTPTSDSPQVNAMASRILENPLLGKVDTRAAARFLSVTASPKLKSFEGKPLLGSYDIDEEGVQSRDVQLIENGILKNLLTTRTPVKGFDHSNGHSRAGSSTPSVIQVTSTKKLTTEQLKQELINIVKEDNLPFGYIVRGVIPPSEAAEMEGSDSIATLLVRQQGPPEPTYFSLTNPYSIFRVYPDGKEEPVRGIEFRSFNIDVLKDIAATSDTETVYDYPANAASLASGVLGGLLGSLGASALSGQDYYATVITPSLLIEEVDMKKTSGNYRKPPSVDYPLP